MLNGNNSHEKVIPPLNISSKSNAPLEFSVRSVSMPNISPPSVENSEWCLTIKEHSGVFQEKLLKGADRLVFLSYIILLFTCNEIFFV